MLHFSILLPSPSPPFLIHGIWIVLVVVSSSLQLATRFSRGVQMQYSESRSASSPTSSGAANPAAHYTTKYADHTAAFGVTAGVPVFTPHTGGIGGHGSVAFSAGLGSGAGISSSGAGAHACAYPYGAQLPSLASMSINPVAKHAHAHAQQHRHSGSLQMLHNQQINNNNNNNNNHMQPGAVAIAHLQALQPSPQAPLAAEAIGGLGGGPRSQEGSKPRSSGGGAAVAPPLSRGGEVSARATSAPSDSEGDYVSPAKTNENSIGVTEAWVPMHQLYTATAFGGPQSATPSHDGGGAEVSAVHSHTVGGACPCTVLLS